MLLYQEVDEQEFMDSSMTWGKFDSIVVVKLFVEKAKFFTTAVLRCYRQDMDRESFKNFFFLCILQYRIALCRTNK